MKIFAKLATRKENLRIGRFFSMITNFLNPKKKLPKHAKIYNRLADLV